MTTELWTPPKKIIDPRKPSYLKLDMAMDGASDSYLFDKSRYRSHGTISGAAWSTGAHGKALDFNPATPSYVEIDDEDCEQLDFTSEDFSLVMRVRWDATAGVTLLFSRGVLYSLGWLLYADTGTLVMLTCQAADFQYTQSFAASYAAATWYTIGFSRDGAAVTIYVNGVDRTWLEGTHVDPVTTTTNALLGCYYDKVNYPLDGKIEFLRIFGGIALPAETHLAFHNALA